MANSAAKFDKAQVRKAFEDFIAGLKSPHKDGRTSKEQAPGVEFVTDDEAQEEPQKRGLVRLVWWAKGALFVVAGMIIVSNAQPYIYIAHLFGQSIGKLGIAPLLVQVPILGWLITVGASLLESIAGIIGWFLLQTLQMLHTLFTDSPAMMLALIAWSGQFSKVRINDSDNESLKRLKAGYNAIPTKWLDDALTARAIGYLIDLGLVLWVYPPIVGGMSRIGVFLSAPSFSDIDVNNLLVGLFAMFGVEVVYKVYKLFAGFVDLTRYAAAE
jgi:hypothetical protein